MYSYFFATRSILPRKQEHSPRRVFLVNLIRRKGSLREEEKCEREMQERTNKPE